MLSSEAIKKAIPNIITLTNLSFGVLSILAVYDGDYVAGAVLIMLAAFIDRYDGKAARYFNTACELGKSLDSLSDLISFGVAPGILMFVKFNSQNTGILPLMILLAYVVCGAYRLARYNVTEFDGFFMGVPITVAGFMIAAFSLWAPCNLTTEIISNVITVLLAFLMVSKFKLQKR